MFLWGNTSSCGEIHLPVHEYFCGRNALSCWEKYLPVGETFLLWNKCTSMWDKHTFLLGNAHYYGATQLSVGDSNLLVDRTHMPMRDTYSCGNTSSCWGTNYSGAEEEDTFLWRNASSSEETHVAFGEMHLPVRENIFLWGSTSFCVPQQEDTFPPKKVVFPPHTHTHCTGRLVSQTGRCVSQ